MPNFQDAKEVAGLNNEKTLMNSSSGNCQLSAGV